MATIDAYGARFIGNDMVAPRVGRQAVRRVAAPQPQYASQQVYGAVAESASYQQPAAADYDYDTQLAPARWFGQVTQLLTLRTGLIALSVVVLIAALIAAVPRLPAAWHATHTVASRIALGASVDLHHTKPHSFVMPSHSILVKNSELSTFVDAIESQTITISVGSTTVTPSPLDIEKWFTQSAGPEKGSTIMQANTANISAYLAGVAQKDAPSTSSNAISNATSQLAQSILKYNGATASLTDN